MEIYKNFDVPLSGRRYTCGGGGGGGGGGVRVYLFSPCRATLLSSYTNKEQRRRVGMVCAPNCVACLRAAEGKEKSRGTKKRKLDVEREAEAAHVQRSDLIAHRLRRRWREATEGELRKACDARGVLKKGDLAGVVAQYDIDRVGMQASSTDPPTPPPTPAFTPFILHPSPPFLPCTPTRRETMACRSARCRTCAGGRRRSGPACGAAGASSGHRKASCCGGAQLACSVRLVLQPLWRALPRVSSDSA